jgi:hypothetical protein
MQKNEISSSLERKSYEPIISSKRGLNFRKKEKNEKKSKVLSKICEKKLDKEF